MKIENTTVSINSPALRARSKWKADPSIAVTPAKEPTAACTAEDKARLQAEMTGLDLVIPWVNGSRQGAIDGSAAFHFAQGRSGRRTRPSP